MTDARYRTAAYAYVAYGIVYWAGGMWLLSQGVGVMGGRTGGATTASMLRWGLIGLVPLIVIPLLLWRRWSWLGGVLSRRTFAWLIVLLLAARTWKVTQVVLHGDASAVAAPWGGSVTFQAGGLVFLLVTVAALIAVARAALTPDAPPDRMVDAPATAHPSARPPETGHPSGREKPGSPRVQ